MFSENHAKLFYRTEPRRTGLDPASSIFIPWSRINRAAREDDEWYGAAGGDPGWLFGPRLRNRGSLHSDVWEGTAADLAARNAMAVYPTGGWWREKPALRRADRRVRYALVVSLRAPVEVDLYIPIETAVGIPVEVEV